MNKKILAAILKAPALLLLIASFTAGIYAAANNIQDMGWEVPIILGVVIFLYGIGSNIEKKHYQALMEEIEETPIKNTPQEEINIPEEDNF